MKRKLGIVMVLSLVIALAVIAQGVKPGKETVVDLGKGVKIEMVLIPAGKFNMGFTKKELDEFTIKVKEDLGEKFVDYYLKLQGKHHEVTLTKPFYMSKYEVTQEQWKSVMGTNPSDSRGVKSPVTNISWLDCQEFVKKLNAMGDGGYRLPTEAEWEYACRAGTTTVYAFGNTILPLDANYSDSNIGKPVEIGCYKPNGFGLYDMHGNVGEWCEDWHGDYPTGAVSDPKGVGTGEHRVMRGGSFVINASVACSSFRIKILPTNRNFFLGFRLAKTI
jgi:hypothetical protein